MYFHLDWPLPSFIFTPSPFYYNFPIFSPPSFILTPPTTPNPNFKYFLEFFLFHKQLWFSSKRQIKTKIYIMNCILHYSRIFFMKYKTITPTWEQFSHLLQVQPMIIIRQFHQLFCVNLYIRILSHLLRSGPTTNIKKQIENQSL